MKKVLTLFLFLSTPVLFAQNWALDKSHANVRFTVTHLMISDVEGKFTDFDAKIVASKEDLSDAVITMSAKIASINTDNERRDGHLKSADFFDAEKFPTLEFKSTSFKKVSGKNYKLAGNLTMHGVTKPITFDVIMNGPIEHPRSKKQMVGLKVSGELNRVDFGVGTAGGVTISEEIVLTASGEFTKE